MPSGHIDSAATARRQQPSTQRPNSAKAFFRSPQSTNQAIRWPMESWPEFTKCRKLLRPNGGVVTTERRLTKSGQLRRRNHRSMIHSIQPPISAVRGFQYFHSLTVACFGPLCLSDRRGEGDLMHSAASEQEADGWLANDGIKELELMLRSALCHQCEPIRIANDKRRCETPVRAQASCWSSPSSNVGCPIDDL